MANQQNQSPTRNPQKGGTQEQSQHGKQQSQQQPGEPHQKGGKKPDPNEHMKQQR